MMKKNSKKKNRSTKRRYSTKSLGHKFAEINEILKAKGLFFVISLAVKKVAYLPTCYFYKLFFSKRTFRLAGKEHHYFYHNHNNTWRGERAVEIPFAKAFIDEFLKKHENLGKYNKHDASRKRESIKCEILEVGNVLSNYFSFEHDIVDKYDSTAKDVINKDIVNYNPGKKYDRIVSISTLEHVGWDETPRRPERVIAAFNSIRRLLSSGGMALITIPLGYNAALDKFLQEAKIQLDKVYLMRRISKDNQWEEYSDENFKNLRYGYPYPVCAAKLLIGIIKK
jgi:hypothetical protein